MFNFAAFLSSLSICLFLIVAITGLILIRYHEWIAMRVLGVLLFIVSISCIVGLVAAL